MLTQYEKDTIVQNYLEKLGTHPVTIAKVLDDSICETSYQILKENPTISKKEFLKKLGIEEYRQ